MQRRRVSILCPSRILVTHWVSLSAAQISALSSKGISILDATDNELSLSLEQYNALGSTKLTASDAISVADAGAKLSSLSAAQIATLATAGIDGLDATDNKLALSLDQYNALGTTKLTASDTVTLSDSGTKLAALTAAQIASLTAAGIDELDASNNSYTLSSAQYKALGSIKLSSSDVVTIVADGDVALSNGGNHLTLTGSAISGTGNSLANTISGNAKNNILAGLEGDDFLYGGLGNDQLNGGSGRDVFVFDTRPTRARTWTRSSTSSPRMTASISTTRSSPSWVPVRRPSRRSSSRTCSWRAQKAKDEEDRIVYDKKTGRSITTRTAPAQTAQVKIATISNKDQALLPRLLRDLIAGLTNMPADGKSYRRAYS